MGRLRKTTKKLTPEKLPRVSAPRPITMIELAILQALQQINYTRRQLMTPAVKLTNHDSPEVKKQGEGLVGELNRYNAEIMQLVISRCDELSRQLFPPEIEYQIELANSKDPQWRRYYCVERPGKSVDPKPSYHQVDSGFFAKILGISCRGSKDIYHNSHYDVIEKVICLKVSLSYKTKRIIVLIPVESG